MALGSGLKVLVIDCQSTKVPAIVEALETEGALVVTLPLEVCSHQLATMEYDAMVISGGPRLFTDQQQSSKLRSYFNFLKVVTKPILGICLGHQAIALHRGSEVYRDAERRQTEIIQVSKPHPLISGLGNHFEMATDHCEGVKLPLGFELIASSAYYPVEVIADDDNKQYGVQFHPEVSGKNGQRLFRNFLSLVKKD